MASSRSSESIGISELDETWTIVAELPTRQREVVVLRFYEDLTIDQIASMLGDGWHGDVDPAPCAGVGVSL